MSQSVTVRPVFAELLLQIEIFSRRVHRPSWSVTVRTDFGSLDVTDQDLSWGENGMSKSVTSGTVFAELLLQIETFGLDVFFCFNL